MFEVFRKDGHSKHKFETSIETFSDMRKYGILFIFFLILLFAAATAMVMGAYDICLADVYATILANSGLYGDVSTVNKLYNTIIWNIRFPRILLSITVGAALASSGAVFQGCFRNPLVEPYILGVSSGSAFGAALGIVYPSVFSSIQISAFIFGSFAVAMHIRSRGLSTGITQPYGAMFLIPFLLTVEMKATGKGINDSLLNGFNFISSPLSLHFLSNILIL